jgi:large subunit ribosomal protein L10
MTPAQKNEAIAVLKGKFKQYDNFYITDTAALTVAQVSKLRRICFEKNVEMKVAKNSLIKKAMEQLDNERFKGTFDSLQGVTALLFSESAKEPALIITDYRVKAKTEKPLLKAAFVDGSVFKGNDQLEILKTLKSKQQLIGEIIGLLQSPAITVISALNAGSKLAGLLQALEDREETAA